MDLENARLMINQIDKELVRLIEERMKAVVTIGEYKKEHNLPILDAKREAVVLQRVSDQVQNKEFNESVLEIFQGIMETTKKFQQNEIIDKN